MQRIILVCLAVYFIAGIAVAAEPQMPKPTKEHEWLQQLVGEWDIVSDLVTEPGKPPTKSKGTESSRMLGGFFAVSEIKSELMGAQFSGIQTIGYDPEQRKYTATWIDSVTSRLWVYGGTLDTTGKILTLVAEGPCPMEAGKQIKYRDVIELKGKDQKVVTSAMEQDGKWITFQTATYTRKK